MHAAYLVLSNLSGSSPITSHGWCVPSCHRCSGLRPSNQKMAVLLANTTYRPALQRLVDNGSMEGAQQDWAVLEGLRSVTFNAGLPQVASQSISRCKKSVILSSRSHGHR